MKFRKNAIKIYRVTFNQYTNCMQDTVCKNTENMSELDYIDCDRYSGSLLIKENEYNLYQQYGGGIKTMELVGILYE